MNIFVTGTDTGIGKTLVSTVLALKLGFHYWKPVQTGSELGIDSDFVSQFLDRKRIFKEAYCFRQPLSPDQAAHAQGRKIEITSIIAQRPKCNTVIEGAGGVLVPLNEREKMIDLMVQMQSPIILVARSSLGTINHTLLSVEALRARSLQQIAVILVGKPNQKNRMAIEKMGQVSVVGEIPELEELTNHSLNNACKYIKIEETQWIKSINS